MGAEMFILRRLDNREADAANPVIRAFNKRHAAIRVQVEWGIGGLKNTSNVFGERAQLEEICSLKFLSHAVE
jgi:hypothetical protein